MNYSLGTLTIQNLLQNDICRLCLSYSEDLKPSAIGQESIYIKIFDCIGLKITADAELNRVCEKCVNKIEKFHIYKSTCHENELKIQNLIESSQNYQQEETIDSNDCKEETQLSENEDNTPLQETSKQKCTVKIEKDTYCYICFRDLGTRENYISHASSAHGVVDGRFKCYGCEKTFPSRATRHQHEQRPCKYLKQGFLCTTCNKYIPTRSHFEKHKLGHIDNKPITEEIKCRKCTETFNDYECYIRHTETHKQKTKKYVCESCGRVFTRRDYLTRHAHIHTGQKNYECPQCGFRTRQKNALTTHIRKHTGERPYSCDLCPQRCVSSSNLRAHRARHSGVKKYECPICPKKFGYKSSLLEHRATAHAHHAGHACASCGARYARAAGLRRHVHAKHAPSLTVTVTGGEVTAVTDNAAAVF